ncbi:tetratricopeptide repeat protein [Nocardia sp. NBC_00416]|uniref:tetratricopeptide repeat protein n=1 Tax=Nocardia sp. NBC_00416 TaxID=2975991 RepID=UPI002E2520E4
MREPLPRTSTVSGVLSGLSVLASALLLELGRNLVMNSFGDGAEVQLLASGLRWLSVAVIVLAVVYTGYRLTAERRSRARLARRRMLLADLDGPALTEPVTPPPPPPPPQRDPGLAGDPVAAALRELPVTEYDAATVYAIATAVGMEQALAPEPPPSGDQTIALGERWTASDLLARLVAAGVLVCHQPQRYRLARVPVSPGREVVIAGAVWQAALFALLCHNADRAASWAAGATTVPSAPRARRWFIAAEPRLRALVRRCCRDGIAHAIPPATAAQLVRIGDALDIWYAVSRAEGGETRAVARDLAELGPDALGGHQTAVLLRAGRLTGSPSRWQRPWRRATGVRARAEHGAGLRLLDTATTPEALAAAVDRLRAAYWRLPREDLANQVRVLADLAVAHIHQGRLDAAQDRLELAALRALDDEDIDGWARVHELAGAVYWARGEPRAALRCWQRALTSYRDLADDNGIGRCLQHLGAAVLIAPEHGDLVLGGDGAPGAPEVLRRAHSWLAEAGRRDPGTAYVSEYLARAATIRGVSEPPDLDHWPVAVRDATGTDPV